MKPLLFNYECAQCGSIIKAPGLPDSAYGEFVLFDNLGGSVYLNSFNDPVFNELELLFKSIRREFNKIDEKNAADIFQAIFSITCDPSPNGGQYKISGFPVCKSCGSRVISSWDAVKPLEVIDEIASPTHDRWNKLTNAEKELKIKEAIRLIFMSVE